jgi:HSP20 family protein
MTQIVNFRPAPTTKSLVNGLFDELFNRNVADFMGSDVMVQRPAVNVLETKDSFQIEVAAPGFQKGDFELKVEKNLFTVSAQHKEVVEEQPAKDMETAPEKRYTRREFRFESFKRTFTLPESIDQSAVSATYDNGILNIMLPKREEVKPAVKVISVG